MKICIVCGFYPLIKGGAEYQSKIIAQALKDMGHDVFFISYGHSENNKIICDEFLIYTLKLPSRKDRLLLNIGYSKIIKTILMSERPDVIYQRVLNSLSFHLSRFSKTLKTPLCIHIADNFCLEFGSTFRDRIRHYMFKSLIRNKLVKFVVQTDYQSKLLKKFQLNPVLKIYNMHPMPTLSGLESKLMDGKRVVWIGSARKVKQLEIFLNLAEKFSESELIFEIIGRIGSTDYEQSLLNRIETMKNVKYLGEVDNDFVNNRLLHTHILVNTSLSEGFSNTFIQAWMRGVPTISLNSDPDGIIKRHDLGFVCDGDTSLLYDYTLLLFRDKGMYQTKSKNARAVAESLFTLENNIQNLERTLENQLDNI